MKWSSGWAIVIWLFVFPHPSAGETPGGVPAGIAVQPVFGVDNKTYPFGTVHEGQVVVREFIVTNSGNAPLLLSKIVNGCACVSVPVAPVSIAVGEKLPLRVSFNTDGFSGAQTRDVQLVTNDPQQPLVTLQMSGMVKGAIDISPTSLNFQEVLPGQTYKRDFSISFTGAEPKVSASSPSLKLTKLAESSSESRYSVLLSLDSASSNSGPGQSTPVGDFRERILIDGGGAARALPVVARVVGEWIVSPSKLEFGVLSNANKTRSLTVTKRAAPIGSSAGQVGSEKLSVKVSGGSAVSATVAQPDSGSAARVVVAVDPARVAGDLQSTVALYSGGIVVAEIPVHGVLPAHLD